MATSKIAPAPPVNAQNIRSKERVRDLAEVFTADREVQAMLDLVGPPTWAVETTFLEPSCGNGNFLVAIMDRKLSTIFSSRQRAPQVEGILLRALTAVYAVDICPENVADSRRRMWERVEDAWSGHMNTRRMSDTFRAAAEAVLAANIRTGDFLKDRHLLRMIEYVPVGSGRHALKSFLLSDISTPLASSRLVDMAGLPSAIDELLKQPSLRLVAGMERAS